MAVQIPDPGTGNGQTGDNEYVFRKKVKDNFSDQTNAASKLVGAGAEQVPLNKHLGDASTKSTGTGAGRVPLSEHAFTAALGHTGLSVLTDIDLNTMSAGTRFVLERGITLQNPVLNTPNTDSRYLYVETVALYSTSLGVLQKAVSWPRGDIWYRTKNTGNWYDWMPASQHTDNYNLTTAAGANAVVDSSGKIMRSTSSERYKDILAPLELDDARYEDAMALKPIVYRSTAGADNPAYHFYSFSAEELGAYDPAFTLWRETETVTDDEGKVTEQPLAERQAEGININALLAMSHAIAIKQDKIIKALESRIEILEAK